MTMKKWARAAVVTGTALTGATAMLVTFTGVASAATLESGHNKAYAEKKCARAYDGERDGRGVYADVILNDGRHASVWDGNGADGSWGPTTCWNTRIVKFRVVEDGGPSSDWISNP